MKNNIKKNISTPYAYSYLEKKAYLTHIEFSHTSKSTYNAVITMLNKVEQAEDYIGCDIALFNYDELESFLKGLSMSNTATLSNLVSQLRKYIEFYAIYHADQNIDLTPINSITSAVVKTLVFPELSQQKHVSLEQLHTYLRTLMNPQDQAIFILLYLGIKGKNYYDLCHLTQDQVDIKGEKIILGDRVIPLTDRKFKFLLEEALLQIKYYTRDDDNPCLDINPDNPYVIKRIQYKKDGLEPLTGDRIKWKINNFAKCQNCLNLTGTSIYNSGLAARFLASYPTHTVDQLTIREATDYLTTHNETLRPDLLLTIARQISE